MVEASTDGTIAFPLKAFVAWYRGGFGDTFGEVYHTETRGRARAEAAAEWGLDFDDRRLRVRRERRLDPFAGKCPPDDVMRECGFTGDDERTCDSCGLGDPSCGEQRPWVVCDDCHQCGECGCCDDCERPRMLKPGTDSDGKQR